MQILGTFEGSDQNSTILVIFETTYQFSFKCCQPILSVIKHNFSVLSKLKHYIYTLAKSSPLKGRFWSFWVLGSKLLNSSCQFWTSQFLFKFCIFLHCHNKNFLNLKLIHFLLGIKVTHKSSNFEFQILSQVLSKFTNFLMLFSKPQVSFSSKFVSLPSVMKDNSSVLFQIKHYILFAEGTNQSVHFWYFRVLGSKPTKFFSVLKQQVCFSSNFASIFSVIRDNSSVLF